MSEIIEEMSAFFNARATRYNTVHVEHVDGGMESKNIIASLLPEHSKTIINLGIGTGFELGEIFKRFPDIKVIGIDIAENMLQRLRADYPGKDISLHNMSYFDYDFEHNYYDAAISVMTLHHYDHRTKTKLYRTIRGSLKQNGVYIECDYILSDTEHENAQALEDSYFAEYERIKNEQGITDNREYHYDTPCTLSNQKKMLENAGFSHISVALHRKNTSVIIAKK